MAKNYAALADTIKIEDITSNDINQTILRRLKDNISIHYSDKLHLIKGDQDHNDYILDDGEDIGWLGYYIGQNTTLQSLNFYQPIDNESFFKEISCNTSIQKVYFNFVDVGEMLSMLGKFFQNNNSLIEIGMEDCVLNTAEGVHQLTLAIGNCNKSLKHLSLTDNEIGEGQLVNIITALSVHPQIERLTFTRMNIDRNECTALATLLRCTTTQLQLLELYGNNIDDEAIGLLVPALCGHTLRDLKLGSNRSITINGWKAVSSLLEAPDSKLKTLHIHGNNIGDDGALVFANSLTNNSTLYHLDLDRCGITLDGWIPFSNLLCDTSSINKTYLSNHTLRYLGDYHQEEEYPDHFDISANLEINEHENKQQVAMFKILHAHSHFDMKPFFEWDIKVLPIMIEWFTKAANCTNSFEEGIKRMVRLIQVGKMTLTAVFDFIKEFPMLYIEPVTRKAIAEYTALEEELQGGDQMVEQQARLEEVRRCKARAMRRLGLGLGNE